MPESKKNSSHSEQRISDLSVQADCADDSLLNQGPQTGAEVLQRMEKTIAQKVNGQFNMKHRQSFKTDDILAGKYQIIDFLNSGNAGMVYQARHIMLNKIFAIKVLSPADPFKDVSNERFQREAHAAASLSHPNIISVHDFGTLPDGTLYLAMEYLEGETLANILERHERLDFKRALPLFVQICLALEYAHTQGVIHRDLKPSNIMIVKDYKGEELAKVIDFSIAKFTTPKPNQRTITKPGQIFGTPLYMSPEQCQGKKPDNRSDIYSLGCVIYETLCGTPPLMGDSALNTIYKHVNELPIPFSQHAKEPALPGEVEALVFKALAKLPEDRYQSASELRVALESLNKTSQLDNPSSQSTLPPQYKPATNKMLMSFLAFLLACFIIGLCIILNLNFTH